MTIEDRFWNKVRKSDGCWEWTASCFTQGYGRFAITSRNVEGAHRMAWILTNGPIPDGRYVCHRCDNRRCCRPDHLFIGTAGDNIRDMFAKGRAVTGLRRTKLPVERILELFRAGTPKKAIARMLGVAPSLIRYIITTRTKAAA